MYSHSSRRLCRLSLTHSSPLDSTSSPMRMHSILSSFSEPLMCCVPNRLNTFSSESSAMGPRIAALQKIKPRLFRQRQGLAKDQSLCISFCSCCVRSGFESTSSLSCPINSIATFFKSRYMADISLISLMIQGIHLFSCIPLDRQFVILYVICKYSHK